MSHKLAGALIVAGVIGLSGCSSFSKALNLEDSTWSTGNYREQEQTLAEALEVPPTLVNPSRQGGMSLFDGQGVADGGVSGRQIAQMSDQAIPAYRAKGVEVKSSLCERWLQLSSMPADEVWRGVQQFLKTLGYPIKEANRATGIIRTEYVQRKEVVPLEDVSPLRKLFNKWRPEVADGALDRFTVHVTVNPDTGVSEIRFHHHQVFALDDGDTEQYQVRPYDPVKELEMLYQSAIFFGARKEAALKQVKVTTHKVEIVNGEALDGLVLHAPISEAWAYLQSMIWRADWRVVSVSPERHQMVLSLTGAEQEKGFWSSLAFWKRRDALPERVVLTLEPVKGKPQQSLLRADVPEGEKPLDDQMRRKLFRKLGLLSE